MYIEHYSSYVVNCTTKRIREIKISADTAQDAHKNTMIQTHAIYEEITKIVDNKGEPVYTLKDGFLEVPV